MSLPYDETAYFTHDKGPRSRSRSPAPAASAAGRSSRSAPGHRGEVIPEIKILAECVRDLTGAVKKLTRQVKASMDEVAESVVCLHETVDEVNARVTRLQHANGLSTD